MNNNKLNIKIVYVKYYAMPFTLHGVGLHYYNSARQKIKICSMRCMNSPSVCMYVCPYVTPLRAQSGRRPFWSPVII